jgi:hypothetical protein
VLRVEGRTDDGFESLNSRFDSSAEKSAGDDYCGRNRPTQTQCADGVFSERYAFENASPVAGDLLDVLADGFNDVVDGLELCKDSLQLAFDFRAWREPVCDLGGIFDLEVPIQIAGLKIAAFVLFLCVDGTHSRIEFARPGLPVELGVGG